MQNDTYLRKFIFWQKCIYSSFSSDTIGHCSMVAYEHSDIEKFKKLFAVRSTFKNIAKKGAD